MKSRSNLPANSLMNCKVWSLRYRQLVELSILFSMSLIIVTNQNECISELHTNVACHKNKGVKWVQIEGETLEPSVLLDDWWYDTCKNTMETFSKFKIAKTIYWLGQTDFISLSNGALERAERRDSEGTREREQMFGHWEVARSQVYFELQRETKGISKRH